MQNNCSTRYQSSRCLNAYIVIISTHEVNRAAKPDRNVLNKRDNKVLEKCPWSV